MIKDVSDFFAAGGTPKELQALADGATDNDCQLAEPADDPTAPGFL